MSTTWLRESQLEFKEDYESKLLRDFSVDYASKLSYKETEKLVGLRMGNDKLSDQRIFGLVSEYASAIKKTQESQIERIKIEDYRCMSHPVDIYDGTSKEVLFFSDGVCESKQKSKRDGLKQVGKARTTTSIMLLQKSLDDSSHFKTIIAAQGVEVPDLIQSELLLAYGSQSQSLPIVAISDGARSIKNEVKAIFGSHVIHILDWYHLQAKVHQLMSQIATSKLLKEEGTRQILNYLWTGNLIQAVLVLKFMVAKNEIKRNELVAYLEKNQHYIIDYERRKAAGKTIGTGRTEKQNDRIIAKRQKRKAMAWSENGSRNLAIVTAYYKYSA